MKWQSGLDETISDQSKHVKVVRINFSRHICEGKILRKS